MAAHQMTPARRAALRKAQLASAKKRRKKGGLAKRLDQNTKNRRARNRALATGKRPKKMSTGRRIHEAGKLGATYGGIATLSGKGALGGYAAGAAIGAGIAGAQGARKKIKKYKKARVKARAR